MNKLKIYINDENKPMNRLYEFRPFQPNCDAFNLHLHLRHCLCPTILFNRFVFVFFLATILGGYDRYGSSMYDRGYNRFSGRDPVS